MHPGTHRHSGFNCRIEQVFLQFPHFDGTSFGGQTLVALSLVFSGSVNLVSSGSGLVIVSVMGSAGESVVAGNSRG